MVYVSVRLPSGDESIGTAFHVGEGVFLTARHVVDRNEILEVASTVSWDSDDSQGGTSSSGGASRLRPSPAEGTVVGGPYYHPDESVDVAALIVTGFESPALPLGSQLDDWLNDEAFILREVIIMGYPPVPLSRQPLLITTRAEVNTIVDKYSGRHPHFALSTMARGGFSGGPCIIEWDFVLGMNVESLVASQTAPPETGYLSAISIEPLYECLAHHDMLPACQKEGWDGLWDVQADDAPEGAD